MSDRTHNASLAGHDRVVLDGPDLSHDLPIERAHAVVCLHFEVK